MTCTIWPASPVLSDSYLVATRSHFVPLTDSHPNSSMALLRRSLEEEMQLKTKVSKIVVEGGRHTDKRRGTRMNSRVPVRLEWEAQGARRGLDAHTRVVNPYGCMIVLPESLSLEHRIALTNLATGSSNAPVAVS